MVLGALAARYNTGFHVDCCLGSFIVSFPEQAGFAEDENGRYKLTLFDFRVCGVTGISCDAGKPCSFSRCCVAEMTFVR